MSERCENSPVKDFAAIQSSTAEMTTYLLGKSSKYTRLLLFHIPKFKFLLVALHIIEFYMEFPTVSTAENV